MKTFIGKRIIFKTFVLLLGLSFWLTSCSNNAGTTNGGGGLTPTHPTTTNPVGAGAQKIFDGSKDDTGWGFYFSESLSQYAGQDAKITVSVDMAIENSGANARLMWQTTTDGYPVIAEIVVGTGNTDWVKVSGTYKDLISIGSGTVLYLSTYETTPKNLKIYLKNFTYKVDAQTVDPATVEGHWLRVDSLKAAYVDSGIFENIGFAISDGGATSINDTKAQEGLKYHATTITAENAYKPDSFLWGLDASTATTDFTSTKGTTIKVPKTLNFYGVDNYLEKCKSLGLKMRGHVLVWHSQTPEAFFKEDYDKSKKFVSMEVMEARQEWYIKTVLEHIKDWEDTKNDGKRIIYAWDVVNEAANDGSSNYLRDNGSNPPSNWYKIYNSSKFIVDAFRYANKYAPKDVQLAYNDYNEYLDYKTNHILKIVNDIQKAKNDAELPTRIDVIGMQAHMSSNNGPSVSEVESAIKKYLETGLDLHVTELDIGQSTNTNSYHDFFKLYKKYAKTTTTNGISGVTLWGVDDAASWRGNDNPLIFKKTGGVYVAKPSFYGVIEAAKE